MTALSAAFGPFAGRIWLNSAHQGPLPVPAAEAARRSIADKLAPARITDDSFWAVPERLRTQLAELVGGKPEEIVLGNATSYGLNLLAQGLSLSAGDEVLVVQGDFPATVVPWLQLADRGVTVRFLGGDAAARVDADTLAAALTPRTRVFCTSWVFSFFGHALDLAALGQVCHDHGVLFIVNGSQAVGARPVDVSRLPMDALCCCGFKWLCGPYATGFAWIAGELLARLDYPQPYWLSGQEGDLTSELDYTLTDRRDGTAHDIYGTANFFSYEPWIAALEHLASFGVDAIAAHDQALADRLLDGLDELPYRLISPRRGPQRSTLVLFSHQDTQRNQLAAAALADAGIDAALRNDALRISPHLHNSEDDIDAALAVLTDIGR